MSDDTDWLKKNPRMSVWRSSRFYGQDMDASVMANDQKSKNDILVVSHVPKRSNIPIEKIRQMDFKFPAPVSKKGGVTKSFRFAVPQASVSRPSVNLKSGQSQNGIQGSVKSNGRPSVVGRPCPVSSNLNNASTTKSKVVQKTPMIIRKSNRHSLKSSADLSLLSQSKVVNQSTPNETEVLRSILKQNRNGGRTCARNLLDRKKSSAAKRVNFNGRLNDMYQEKENKEGAMTAVQTEKGSVNGSSDQEKNKDSLAEFDEESTVAFSKSFKPLPADDVDNEVGNEGNVEKRDEEEAKAKNRHQIPSESLDSGNFIKDLMDVWKIYRNKFSGIRDELHLIDETFQRTLKLVMNNQVEEKLSLYQEEKAKLYEKLKDLEVEFRERVKNCTEVKPVLLSYMEKKRSIFAAQCQLEEKFDKALHTVLEKYVKESGVDEERIGSGETNADIVCPSFKTVKRTLGSKEKLGCISGLKEGPTSPKQKSPVSGSSTPDNTPARRRKLSRKIKKQIRSLFDE